MKANASIFTALLLAVLLVPALSGCSNDAGGATEDEDTTATRGAERRTVRVEVQTVAPDTFTDVVELSGSVTAVNDATLSAQSNGTVIRLAELGSWINQGDVIALIRPTAAEAQVEQAEAQLASAEAQLDLARDNYERMEPLYADSIISAVEFENTRAQYNQARAQVNQARAALAAAREQLENTRVRAPFGGAIEERFVELGEQIMPGTPVARIVDTNPVKVVAGVPERYAGDIERGTPVEIDFKAYGDARRTGTVTFVGSAINPDNRTFPIEVQLQNPEGRLKPEMVVRVFLPRETLEDAIVVPRSSVVRDEDSRYVYVAQQTDEGPIAQRQAITLGSSYGDRVVIRSGLEVGDRVVVAGQSNLTTGDMLEIAG